MHLLLTESYSYSDFVVCQTAKQDEQVFTERLELDKLLIREFIFRSNDFVCKVILPEIIAKWFTRTAKSVAQHSKHPVQSDRIDAVCLSSNATYDAGNRLNSVPQNVEDNTEVDIFNSDEENKVTILRPETSAANAQTACYCKQPPSSRMLQCTHMQCTDGLLFHVTCLGYKRVP